MNIINIQSITDIVTNSSTEVFIRIKETAINTVKELINNLLKISGSTLQADDLFTIEILYDDSSDLMVTPKQDTTECIEAAVILSSLRVYLTMKYMKIGKLIPIQSYSDIITNSSSELFCTITSGKTS